MIDVKRKGTYLLNGKFSSMGEVRAVVDSDLKIAEAYKGTITYSILDAHSTLPARRGEELAIKFDAAASHDITYVGIIQSAKASGLTEFPLPYVMTNCHNSLCAVGGTINEDDHVFGLSAARKFGGVYVPANIAVIHTFMRERYAGCGKMILGSDSHTRYGAIGTLGIGEGGPEIVKQLLGRTYDVTYPEVVAVELTGNVRKGVGPHDVALAIIGEVFKDGFVRNKILEFIGDGIGGLDMEFRNGIDVMTTETACLSSIWTTDEKTREYLKTFAREDEYKELKPAELAYYDDAVTVELDKIEPMIALPFHPSNVYRLRDVIENPHDVFAEVENNYNGKNGGCKVRLNLADKIKDGKVLVSQGVIAGCAGGTFNNIYTAANIVKGANVGNGEFSLNVYPGSQPVNLELIKDGAIATLISAGAVVKPCFCGPCFGAGDTPCNNGLSIRHTTRNFENREGSKPSGAQIAAVALMDSRSIAATAKNGGVLTSAFDVDFDDEVPAFRYDGGIYDNRVYDGFGKANATEPLIYGPNICDWPEMPPLTDNLIIKVVAAIYDEVTTTDELIPSGETSSYRSNPMKLAKFTLSRRCPDYYDNATAVAAEAKLYGNGEKCADIDDALAASGLTLNGTTSVVSTIYAVKPGDGSAREQAASCQRVLGAGANIAVGYATKRYRSNLINWGILPFLSDFTFEKGDTVILADIRKNLTAQKTTFGATLVRGGEARKVQLRIDALTDEERDIILAGSLINYYKNGADGANEEN